MFIIINLLGIIIIPASFVISCNKKDEGLKKMGNLNGFTELMKNPPYPNTIFEIKILDWKDGDTAGFEYKDKATEEWINISGGKRLSLRIASIDTPESHDPSAFDSEKVGSIGELELKWAKKAGDWARKEIPVGTIVKVWKTGIDAYSRWTGSIFYTKDKTKPFNENFSVNIIKEGLTYPRVASKETVLMSSFKSKKVLHYLGMPLYDAYVQATNNKKNLFSLSKQDLEIVYKMHGIPLNALTYVPKIANDENWLNVETFSKFKIYKQGKE